MGSNLLSTLTEVICAIPHVGMQHESDVTLTYNAAPDIAFIHFR